MDGLTRLSDGRWRASGPERYTFTEPNEDLAVLRFREWQSRKTGRCVQVPLDTAGLTTQEAIRKAAAMKVVMMAGPDGDAPTFTRAMPEAEFWAAVRSEILRRPGHVAQMTGIEQIGYLTDLKPPEKLPTFDDLEKLWTDHATARLEEKRKVMADWRRFVAGSSIAGLRDITPEACIAYRRKVHSLKLGGKRQQHLFNRARRMLTFAASQAVSIKACNEALAAMRLLTPNDSTVTIDPDPIKPADFKALLSKAEGDDRAMLLLMLNAALHMQEAVDLRWDDIHGDVLIAHRKKKGKFLRIATLWTETIEALKAVPQRSDFIFCGAVTGAQLTVSGAGKRFRSLRECASVPHVVSDQIRDGAATAAAAANINDQLFNLLMGHRNPGMKDNYAKRNPMLVRPACDAVYHHYFGA